MNKFELLIPWWLESRGERFHNPRMGLSQLWKEGTLKIFLLGLGRLGPGFNVWLFGFASSPKQRVPRAKPSKGP